MPPTASLTYTYADEDDVVFLLSEDGDVARLDDDASGYVGTAEAAFRAKAIQWATARCNYYLLARIDASDLKDSWIVSQWCAIVAAYIISCRRGNPSAASLKTLYDEAIEDMKAVQRGEVTLPDVATRTASFPAWSNIRMSLSPLRRLRVERPLSETRTPVDYPQVVDRSADYINDNQ